MLRLPPLASLATLMVLGGVAVVPAAQAATYTANGVRCTIVGAARADRLVGTAGRDVICGLGGNDVIDGRGGNDVLDGGAGADNVVGGDGADVVRGGLGSDHLTGGAGADDLLGSDGADTVAGGAGSDDVSGGEGGDVLTGGSGNDDLSGNSGNDDLAGNAGADHLNGGSGTNWCTPGATDTEKACKYDAAPPASDTASLSTHRVDVSDADRRVTVRVHVTDDTGVADVSVSAGDDTGNGITMGYGHLVEGTLRNGWWEATLMAAHWSAPGQFTLDVSLRDRVGRGSSRHYTDQVLTVIDANPDLDLPQVELLAPTPTARYDVRSSGKDVTVRARIKDAVSGVWYADLCLWKPRDGFYGNLPCAGAARISGDVHNGVWQAVVRIPKGDSGGDWNVGVNALDWAHKDDSPVQWVGPDVYRYWTNDGQNTDPYTQPLPQGLGRFSVVGTSDSTPPVIDSLTFSPDHVDTLNGPATVAVTVHAHDAPSEGVTEVGLALTSTTDPQDQLVPLMALALTEGTAADGIWTGTLTLPQGSPPTTYWVQAWAEDVTHFRSYASSDAPFAGDADQTLLPGDPHLVVGSGG